MVKIPILLASQSPRRAELLKQMGYEYSIKTKDVDENFDKNLSAEQAVDFVLNQKIKAFEDDLPSNLVLCADTMVVFENQILGKPIDLNQAFSFLKALSGQEHRVLTGIIMAHKDQKLSFIEQTFVRFRVLKDGEIKHYIENYNTLDKAGAYGIQEWIGHIGVQEIRGSYTNVMGLPTASLHVKIQEFMARFS